MPNLHATEFSSNCSWPGGSWCASTLPGVLCFPAPDAPVPAAVAAVAAGADAAVCRVTCAGDCVNDSCHRPLLNCRCCSCRCSASPILSSVPSPVLHSDDLRQQARYSSTSFNDRFPRNIWQGIKLCNQAAFFPTPSQRHLYICCTHLPHPRQPCSPAWLAPPSSSVLISMRRLHTAGYSEVESKGIDQR